MFELLCDHQFQKISKWSCYVANKVELAGVAFAQKFENFRVAPNAEFVRAALESKFENHSQGDRMGLRCATKLV
jgi:hypothetical protein